MIALFLKKKKRQNPISYIFEENYFIFMFINNDN